MTEAPDNQAGGTGTLARPSSDAVDRMGTAPVFRLLLSFSIPSIVGMVVVSLYNIVDRIFVGKGVGSIGIAATTVAFPVMLFLTAFSVLVGVGANTLFSIRMGEGRRDQAGRILGNAFLLLFACPLVATLPALWFLDPLLRLVGANADVLPYARTYSAVLIAMAPLNTAGHGLSHFIRSDGHPRISMVAMLIGALVNTALDPLFIFVFGWGIAGAAWATAISQGLSFAWCLSYFLSPWASTPLRRKYLWPRWRAIVFPFLAIGFAPFAMSLANTALNAILNRALDAHGGHDALAVMGILGSFMSIVFMPLMGLTSGVQPLMGYNYGARLYARVRSFFLVATGLCTAILTVGFLLAQLFPSPIVRLFLPENELSLVPLGDHALRIFTLGFPTIGIGMMAGNLYQAIGKPVEAAFLSLTRQVILFIPMLLFFPPLFAHFALPPLDGVYWSAPASDVCAGVIAFLFAHRQLRAFRRLEAASVPV